MFRDPIVEEVHRIRQEWAAQFGHNIEAMGAEIQRLEAESRKRGVKFLDPPKPTKRRKRRTP